MSEITSILGDEAHSLLTHESRTIPREYLHQPGPDFVSRVFEQSDRSPRVLRSLQSLFDQGRLAGTGYLSLLPVDQGVEHSAGASFAKNPLFMDPEKIVELALAGGCSGVASTLGVLGSVSRRYAHHIPFIVKLNHNELLTYPNHYDQTLFASVGQAFDLGAVAVGATIYYGSENSRRQIEEISEAFAHAHELGMATILWAYLRNDAFKQNDADYHTRRQTSRVRPITLRRPLGRISSSRSRPTPTADLRRSTSARPMSASTRNSPQSTPSTSYATRWPVAIWAGWA